jgi:AraC-like DNA-binding protein
VLHTHSLFTYGGISVDDVACHHRQGRGEVELAQRHALVFVRRGHFTREADGAGAFFDPTTAYWMRPGQEQRFDHPTAHGDDCTAVLLDRTLVRQLWGEDVQFPDGVLNVTPELDLRHRVLLARATAGAEGEELYEQALMLARSVLESSDTRLVPYARASTARAHRELAESAREALAADPRRPLVEIASDLAVSPDHLGRIFHRHTGHTLARQRTRLRVRAALERIAAGEANLARLALDVGLTDQSHLTRVVRQETNDTPGRLRADLARVSRMATGRR